MGKKIPKYRLLRSRIITDLENGLDKSLTYHGVHHTLDVCNACNAYIRRMSLNPKQRLLLRTAALMHDYGFIISYKNHEEIGCKIARKKLPDYNYSKKDIEEICAMIMATKIPQSPKNILSRILCDADLDYLGREDFKKIGDTLFQELKNYKVLSSREEWNKIQFQFLSKHEYKTEYGRKYRQPKKQKHIQKLKKWLNKNVPTFLEA